MAISRANFVYCTQQHRFSEKGNLSPPPSRKKMFDPNECHSILYYFSSQDTKKSNPMASHDQPGDNEYQLWDNPRNNLLEGDLLSDSESSAAKSSTSSTFSRLPPDHTSFKPLGGGSSAWPASQSLLRIEIHRGKLNY